ncbi:MULTISPECIES: sensor histidine kinase [unclassified Sedimentibacter]|uniref:sensor histidine kinase n=1 Tax=unclassified Sedimentibacter TaxID=2649220 RepID=UPI0027DEF82D|nr:HAMP domain-containing sensor histidine kinase [Sedimentibacter sp. MB35-C1]WMJ78685.1 HAMP domain-containing sensor histidine kinase [Sedimentibacter sp. MB35-C1]
MKNQIIKFLHTYFDHTLDLRVRIFNVMVLISACFCLVIAFVNTFAGIGMVGVLVDVAAAIFCIMLLLQAKKPRRAAVCRLIFILISFFALFPYLFFNMGGYHGGIPTFLIFAPVFTVFLLEGKTAVIVTTLELALYAGLYLFAYVNPQSVTMFAEESGFLVSNLMDLLVVSIALCTTMYAQVSLYRAQQKRVDEQNAVLAQVNQAKTQFLANTSHEMRTPLTVISVNIQTVMGLLKRMDCVTEDGEAQELLQDAQAEIMRLSRMVEGMLSLNVIADSTEKIKTNFSALLGNTTEMMRLLLAKHDNALVAEIPDELIVFGNADLLSQVIINLLQNATAHTKKGMICLKAALNDGEIVITVSDNGSGISSQLLPHVFERGVSEGGTGFGLFLCKTVVESHGGRIEIESEKGCGTTVTFTLPIYQGQFGGEDA